MEGNVRTYLGRVGNVNTGIANTLAMEPEKFFAYNNGIAATASAVTTTEGQGRTTLITGITDLQIVNGAQTTASLAAMRRDKKLPAGAVFVPMGERPSHWTPTTTGSGFDFSPILKPIERFRESIVVVSNLDRPPGGTHALSCTGCGSTFVPSLKVTPPLAPRPGQTFPTGVFTCSFMVNGAPPGGIVSGTSQA